MPDLRIIDIHSHLLPGLDDGSRTLDGSLHMCELYVAQGVTPVLSHHKRNTGLRRAAYLLTSMVGEDMTRRLLETSPTKIVHGDQLDVPTVALARKRQNATRSRTQPL